jgi:hypothetical protein
VMKPDPIVEEIRAIREKMAEECGHDLRVMAQRFRESAGRYENKILIPENLQEVKGPFIDASGRPLIYDPIVAEIHEGRRQLWDECGSDALKLHDEQKQKSSDKSPDSSGEGQHRATG